MVFIGPKWVKTRIFFSKNGLKNSFFEGHESGSTDFQTGPILIRVSFDLQEHKSHNNAVLLTGHFWIPASVVKNNGARVDGCWVNAKMPSCPGQSAVVTLG